MPASPRHKLIQQEWPRFGDAARPPQPSADELSERIQATRSAMDTLGLTHLVVYGDREHFANLAYLTAFDPRYEEAILVLRQQGAPLLVVGNECEGYLNVSPLWRAKQLRSERFQPFSLLNQPRDSSRLFAEILSGEGVGDTSRVGCVGWKYFSTHEHPEAEQAIEAPSYLVDTLRQLASAPNVVNATAIFMDPGQGLRTFCSPSEIAYFEFTNVLASEAMRRLIFSIREGMLDDELFAAAQTAGEPLGCHPTLVAGDNPYGGLAGPMGAAIERGRPLSMNICHWGANICRAGWVASSPQDLPADARDYVESFAGPYFEAMSAWFGLLRVGTRGGQLDSLIQEALPFSKFGIFLNAGHLIHLDEWLSSPVYPQSQVPLHSGMAFQTDVIPSSPVYSSTRMEDGVVIADQDLRSRLRTQFPDCYARITARRRFMTATLGIDLPEDVLPLSNIAGIVPPFFLEPNTILAIES